MTRLDIIELRTVRKNREAVEAFLWRWQTQVLAERKALLVKIYRQAELETDFSIHVQYDSKTQDADVCILGERLASDLKDFGLVNHTVWVEQETGKKTISKFQEIKKGGKNGRI
ncbi:MAG TPA: hypothetical protein ENK44_02325 [Caldithrix abyssi]|uniref:Uncharacterized protein n=1 Tax=Caldithrix abyssi TaxID=187145 RepID=A0A7V4UC77_CALAY|nr:hypothetical protein [Caldithrix abyssi]